MPRPACNCISEFDAKVEPMNSQLPVDLLSGAIVIRTDQVRAKRRSNVPYLICTFCPMCGKQYEETLL